MSGAEKIAVKVTDIVPLNDLVTRFKFERVDGGLLPTFSGGAHTVIEMKDTFHAPQRQPRRSDDD